MQNLLYYGKKYGKDVFLYLLVLICIGLLVYNTFIKEEQEDNAIGEIALTSIDTKTDKLEDVSSITKIHVDVKGAVKKPGVYTVSEGTIIQEVIKLAGGFQNNAYQNEINLSKKLKDEMVIYIYTKAEIAAKEKEHAQIQTQAQTQKKEQAQIQTQVQTQEKEQEKTQEKNQVQVQDTISTINETCKVPDYNICECVQDKVSVIETDPNASTSNDKKDDSNIQDNKPEDNKQEEKKQVNINTATIEELTSLSGIGESKAKAIITYREEKGKFNNITDIMNVSGIGESLFAKIKDYITI